MADNVQENRWDVGEDQFAVAIRVDDVKAYFSRTLIVEPGIRAVIIDEGQSLGEVGPGTWTLQSFAERLKFWTRKQATAILVRQEDLPIELDTTWIGPVMTSEHLAVDAEVRLAVQLDDVALFARNLLGPRREFTITELREAIGPLVRQALWSAAGRLSITDLTGPDVREELDANIEQALGISLSRYGLRFVSVHLATLSHTEYDEQRQEKGQLWLLRDEHETASEKQLLELQHRERTQELTALADNLGVDREESKAATMLREIGALSKQRDALLSDKANEFQYQARLAELHTELDHTQSLKTVDHEIELAKKTETQQNLEWQQHCEQERREAEQRIEQSRQQHDLARQGAEQLQEDEWEELVHSQRIDRQADEMRLAGLQRQTRIGKLEAEIEVQQQDARLAMERNQKEWDLEFADSESDAQMKRLKAVQDMNAEFAEREQRTKLEIENLKEDKAHQRAIERMATATGMSAEALIATAGTDNAALLADLKKHEADSAIAAAQSQQTQQMHEKVNEAYKDAMQAQQGNVQQMISAIGQIGQAAAGAPPTPTPTPTPPPVAATVAWHASIDGQQLGPFNVTEIQEKISTGKITATTQVWKADMASWLPAAQVPELAACFAPPPALPPPNA